MRLGLNGDSRIRKDGLKQLHSIALVCDCVDSCHQRSARLDPSLFAAAGSTASDPWGHALARGRHPGLEASCSALGPCCFRGSSIEGSSLVEPGVIRVDSRVVETAAVRCSGHLLEIGRTGSSVENGSISLCSREVELMPSVHHRRCSGGSSG